MVAAEGDLDAPQSSTRGSCHTRVISLVFCLPLLLGLSLSSTHPYVRQSLAHNLSLSCLVWAAAMLSGFMPAGQGLKTGSSVQSRKVSLGGPPLAAQRQTLPLPAMLGGRHGTSTAGMTLQESGSLRGEVGRARCLGQKRQRLPSLEPTQRRAAITYACHLSNHCQAQPKGPDNRLPGLSMVDAGDLCQQASLATTMSHHRSRYTARPLDGSS